MIRVSGNEVEVSGTPEELIKEFTHIAECVFAVSVRNYNATEVVTQMKDCIDFVAEK